ncbi:MAG: type III pantothenate kinase [bacterium]
MSGLLLALDVGNTNILMGLFNGCNLIKDWRFFTRKEQTSDEIGWKVLTALQSLNIESKSVKGAIISCVVPSLSDRLKEMCRNYLSCDPLEVKPGLEEYFPVSYPEPGQIGADRIVNAVAGYEKYGSPLIIVDFGTATTFCAISDKGEFMGGCIVPGIGISLEALIENAERLTHVTWAKPGCIIAKNTEDAIRAGLFFGYASLVNGIVKKMKKEMGGAAKVVATGGWASIITEEAKCIDKIDPYLTLEGLRIIYEKRIKG